MFNARAYSIARLLLLLLLVLTGFALASQAAAQTATESAAGSGESVLATARGETPGLSIELQSLERNSGEVVTLTFAMINDSDKPLEFGYDFVEKGKNAEDFGSIGGAHLIDAAGKKKYLVLRDSEGIPLCSRGLGEIAPKSRANLWAKFPAPPEGVESISVVIPHFIPLDDVPMNQ